MIELLNFILKNKNQIISKNGLFTNDTLMMFKAVINGTINENSKLSNEQKELLINAFLLMNKGFDKNTPKFIIDNPDCILHAVKIDFHSIDCIDSHFDFDEKMEYLIIEEIKKHNYILNENSPLFLAQNYDIALKSIELSLKSCECILWDDIDNNVDNLIDKVIEKGYMLSSFSMPFFKFNDKIVFASIKKDINTAQYADRALIVNNKDIFKYLLENNYHFSPESLCHLKLSYLSDPEIINLILKNNLIYSDNESKEIIARLNNIYNNMLNNKPLLKDFRPILETIIENKWKMHKIENNDMYGNVFATICSQLQNDETVDEAVDNLLFIGEMECVLQNKYHTLYEAMKEYFEIYHSDTENKLEKLQSSQDIIAKLSALYISKSKDNYKNEHLEKYYNKILRPHYKLKENHPIVQKNIIEMMQREEYYQLYRENNTEVFNFINELINKYKGELPENIIKNMISAFITIRTFKVEVTRFIDKPKGYDEYIKYLKIKQLINRLNCGFIKLDSMEVSNYRNLIKYDEKKKQYIYTGEKFTKDEIGDFNKFSHYEQIFNKIKKDLILDIKKRKLTTEIDQNLYNKIAENLPLIDEYFTFDLDNTLNKFNFWNCKSLFLYQYNSKCLLDDESYKYIYDIFINKGLLWLLLLISLTHPVSRLRKTFEESGIYLDNITTLIDNIDKIILLANEFNIDISNFSQLMMAYTIGKCAGELELSILEKETIEKLCKYKEYTGDEEQIIINMAIELVCVMTKRFKSTVPYVKGETMNYKYSMYDSYDETLLLSGIDTDACFRIDGNDHDFLNYCALDKNGFIIKITDHYGNFVARAAGFRNGNCVFINQLRTIHDGGGEGYLGNYEYEKEEIIDAFEQACDDIVNTSHRNSYEKDKIDFVFVTKSYSLSNTVFKNDNGEIWHISDDVVKKIGDNPVDSESEDWLKFLDTAPFLTDDAYDENYMETDYGCYPLLCFASIKEIDKIKPDDLVFKDVKALYLRERSNIQIIKKIDENINRKVNKIRAIYAVLRSQKFKKITIPSDATVFTGDGWYIILHNYEIIDSCRLIGDKRSRIEFEYVMDFINKSIENRNNTAIEQLNDTIYELNGEKELTKVLKK